MKSKSATTYSDDLAKGGIVGRAWADELEKHGAKFVNKNTVADGNFITANGPGGATDGR